MQISVRLLAALALLVLLSGCATTHHYYSASTYPGIRIGDARVSGDVSVTLTPEGVYVAPAVRYYRSHTPARSYE